MIYRIISTSFQVFVNFAGLLHCLLQTSTQFRQSSREPQDIDFRKLHETWNFVKCDNQNFPQNSRDFVTVMGDSYLLRLRKPVTPTKLCSRGERPRAARPHGAPTELRSCIFRKYLKNIVDISWKKKHNVICENIGQRATPFFTNCTYLLAGLAVQCSELRLGGTAPLRWTSRSSSVASVRWV